MEERKDPLNPSYTNPQGSVFPDPTVNRFPEMPSIPSQIPLQMQGDTANPAQETPQTAPAAPQRDTVHVGRITPPTSYDTPPSKPIPPPAQYHYPYGNVNTGANGNPTANSYPNPAPQPQPRVPNTGYTQQAAPQNTPTPPPAQYHYPYGNINAGANGNAAANSYPNPAPQPQPQPRVPNTGYTQQAANGNANYSQLYSDIPATPRQPAETMNRKIYWVAGVIAFLIFLLCLFCIGSDLLQGALGTTETGYEVVVNVQPPPELDPDDEHVTADGTYTVRGVAELVTPSIVEVHTHETLIPNKSNLVGTGSGIVISEDGFIVTNAHVVEGMSFVVVLDNETEYEAELIGKDAKTDIAVLKIDAENLTPATLGDSDKVYVGDQVVAIGNPAGLTNTVTVGFVSAINRQVRADSNAFDMDCIQTDAAISPGNSGGALINMYGQVIGITSSKYASNYIQGNAYEGLGFAITINEALPIVKELISQGYVSGRFRIGISFYETSNPYTAEIYLEEKGEELPAELEGLWIITIDEDCDIANTELQPEDFIIGINGTPVSDYDDVIAALKGYKGGDKVSAACARVEEDGSITHFNIEFIIEVDTSGNY